MEKKYIVALDQGTTSSRAVIFDKNINVIDIAQRELEPIYPKPSWVEQNPMNIWATQRSTLSEVMEKTQILAEEIATIGITNQRETTILWNKKTGKPVYNAIVWQCRRTSEICKKLKEKNTNIDKIIQEKTGLILDPYFSATKIKWILENVPEAKNLANEKNLLFGTVDTWLLWNLTKGKEHATDFTNASRTLLFNIHTLKWDDDLLELFDIPKHILPEVKNSSSHFGNTDLGGMLNINIPISGIAGDQQAALFGHLCINEGMAKNTYGTGCFLLMNTGTNPVKSNNGLLTTICCGQSGEVNYALEGSIFVAGAAIQWLRDELKLVDDSVDSEYFAIKAKSSNGVYVVPAFTGLGAPYWDPYARGTIVGITRGTKADHIIRATLESIAYQTRDIIEAMQLDANMKLKILSVDGGAVANNFLMQFQADILNTQVKRPKILQATALGAVFLAGLSSKFWKNIDELKNVNQIANSFTPNNDILLQETRYKGWKKAVKCAMNWIEEE